MNNLHRELAPISEAAWAQIEEETTRTSSVISLAGAFVDAVGDGLLPSAPATCRRSRHRRRASSPDSER